MSRGLTYIPMVAALCACATAPASGPAEPQPETGAIAGIIADESSGDPLSFANVEATEWQSGSRTVVRATTGADGRYQVPGLPAGTYLVDVTYAEHRARYFAVPVTAGETTALDSRLDTRASSSNASYQYVDIASNPVVHAPRPAPARSAAQSHTTGGIRGRVRDVASNDTLAGAVVAATTPGVDDAKLAIAADDGTYLMRSLRPGTYTLSVYYHLVDRGNIEVRRTGVEVVAGEITEINLDLDSKTDR